MLHSQPFCADKLAGVVDSKNANDEKEVPVGSADPKRVFILGAGFSKAISDLMPVADKLGEEVANRLQLPQNLTRGTFEDWLSRLGEAQPDVSVAHNLQRQSYFEQVVEAIGEELEAKQTEVLDEKGFPLWLLKFVAVVHFWQSTLISFNYDTLVEQAAVAASLKPPNPIPGVPGSANSTISAGDVIGQMPPLPSGPSRSPYQTLRLWKLHGSLAWWWVPGDSAGTTIVRWPIDREELSATTLTQQMDLGSGIKTVPSEPHENNSERRVRLLFGRSRFIAPPSGLKSSYYQNPFMGQLWQNSRQALQNATEIYVVGYSMPPADTAARGLCRESIPLGTKIVVVDRCPGPIVKQLKDWGFKQVEYIDDDGCVEELVERLEQERAYEVVQNLICELCSERIILDENDTSTIVVPGSQVLPQALKAWRIENSSLILSKASQDDAAAHQVDSVQEPTGEADLRASKLATLLKENSIEEIVFERDNKRRRVLDYKPMPYQNFDDKFTLRQLWLIIPGL